MKDHVTVTEAARIIGVSRERVVQLIKAGNIKAERVPSPGRRGFMYLIPRVALRHRRKKNT